MVRSTSWSPTCRSSRCTTVLPALSSCAAPDADIVPMVKPQFEVGKDQVGAGGVVTDPQLRAARSASRRRARRRTGLAHRRCRRPARCPARRATSSTSCSCAPDHERRADGRCARAGCDARHRGGAAVTTDRTILLVVHTGRDEATETARRVEKVLGDNGIGLRVLSAEAVDRGKLHLAPDEMRALGVDIEVVERRPNAAEGCELVLVLGGDGTFLRAAELARNRRDPGARHQSGPHRISRRGRGRSRSTAFSSTSSPGTTASRTA